MDEKVVRIVSKAALQICQFPGLTLRVERKNVGIEMKIRKNFIKIVIVIAFSLAISTASCVAMATESSIVYKNNSVEDLKEKYAKIDNVYGMNDFEKEKILAETDPKILSEFIVEKMDQFCIKLNTLEMEGTGLQRIDLGDGCEVLLTTTDTSEDLELGLRASANTPGGDTLWKNYGNRQFTTKFEFTTGLINWTYRLVNHYKLSSSGVDYRSGDAKIKSGMVIQIGTASKGEIKTHKTVAHKKGKAIHISCEFNCRWAPKADVTIMNKTLDIHSRVKFSDLDKPGKQVKVVQSWNGVWL